MTNSFDTLVSNLKKKRNRHAPINRLMDELLIDIWLQMDIYDRARISQVSSRWYRLAVSTPILCTLINFDQCSFHQFQTLINHSGSTPLHIVATKPNYELILALADKPLRSAHSQNENPQTPGHGQPSINGQAGSILYRCITLDAVIGDATASLFTADSISISMPYLEELVLGVEDWTLHGFRTDDSFAFEDQTWPPMPIFSAQTPQLRSITFTRFHAEWNDPIYRNLQRLSLVCPMKRISLRQLLHILTSCPALHHLHLCYCLTSDTTEITSGTRDNVLDGIHLEAGDAVNLPKMRYLCVEEGEEFLVRALLSALSLPILDHLYIQTPGSGCFTDEYDRPLKSISPTIERPVGMVISSGSVGDDYIGGRNEILSDSGIELLPPIRDDSENDRQQWSWIYFIATTSSKYMQEVSYYVLSESHSKTNWTAVGVSTGDHSTINAFMKPEENLDTIISPDMRYTIDRVTQQTIRFAKMMDQIVRGGVQLDFIQHLEIRNEFDLSDSGYQDFFSRCNGIQGIKMNFRNGIGILVAVIKEQLLPNLTEIFFGGIDHYSSSEEEYFPLELLANWVESRNLGASNNTGGRIAIKKVTKIVIQIVSTRTVFGDYESAKKRIEDALGADGILVWNDPKSQFKASKWPFEDYIVDEEGPIVLNNAGW